LIRGRFEAKEKGAGKGREEGKARKKGRNERREKMGENTPK